MRKPAHPVKIFNGECEVPNPHRSHVGTNTKPSHSVRRPVPISNPSMQRGNGILTSGDSLNIQKELLLDFDY